MEQREPRYHSGRHGLSLTEYEEEEAEEEHGLAAAEGVQEHGEIAPTSRVWHAYTCTHGGAHKRSPFFPALPPFPCPLSVTLEYVSRGSLCLPTHPLLPVASFDGTSFQTTRLTWPFTN